MKLAGPALIDLAAGQTMPLSSERMLVFTSGAADLYLTDADGRQRFVMALAPGTLLGHSTAHQNFLVRSEQSAVFIPGGDAENAALWIESVARAAAQDVDLPGAIASPAAFVAQTERLFEAIERKIETDLAQRLGEAGAANAQNTASFATTIRGFSLLLAGRYKRPPVDAHNSLNIILARLVEAKHVKPLAIRRNEDEDRRDFIERYAAGHGMRLRHVRLDMGALPRNDGPYLLFDRDDNPFLLRPHWRHGFVIEAAVIGAKARPLHDSDWENFAPDGFALCLTLPSGKLRYWDVIRFGLRDSLGDFALMAACGMIGALLALLTPIVSDQIVHIAVHTADTNFLANLVAILAIALVAETSFFIVGHLAELRVEGRSGLALHAAMVDRLLRLSPAALRSSTTLILATQMETVEKFRRALINFSTTGMLALFNGLAAAALLAIVSPMAGLIAIAMVLVLVGFAALIGWAQFKAIYEGERMDVIVLAFVYDLIRLVPLIRATSLEKRAFVQWADNFLAFQSRLMRSAAITNWFKTIEPLWRMVLLALCFAALAFGNSSVSDIGHAVVFVMTLNRFVQAGSSFAHTVLGAAKLLPMTKLSHSLLDQTIEPLVSGTSVTRLHGALETNHVSFFYGGRRVLDDVSLTIAPGEFIGIVGSSGSGKSTLMALLTGQETPLSGVVLLDGSNMRDLDRRQLTRQMGIVTQNSRLFPGSLFDNIRGASAIDMAEAWQLAEEIGLAETISALPMGMKTIITDTGSGLSASQVQRILIARALAGKPLILALDEATSILDGEAQSQIQAALRQRAVTRIVIAHRSSTLQDADRLIRLEHGRIVDIGDPDRILRDMSVYDSRKDES